MSTSFAELNISEINNSSNTNKKVFQHISTSSSPMKNRKDFSLNTIQTKENKDGQCLNSKKTHKKALNYLAINSMRNKEKSNIVNDNNNNNNIKIQSNSNNNRQGQGSDNAIKRINKKQKISVNKIIENLIRSKSKTRHKPIESSKEIEKVFSTIGKCDTIDIIASKKNNKKQLKINNIMKLYTKSERTTNFSPIKKLQLRHITRSSSSRSKSSNDDKIETPWILKLKSNWGNHQYIGWNKIQLYTKNKRQIPFNVTLPNLECPSYTKIPFNKTTITIEIQYNHKSIISEISITNYTGEDKSISTKEIDIYNHHNNWIFSGIIARKGVISFTLNESGKIIPFKKKLVNQREKQVKVLSNNSSSKRPKKQSKKIRQVNSVNNFNSFINSKLKSKFEQSELNMISNSYVNKNAIATSNNTDKNTYIFISEDSNAQNENNLKTSFSNKLFDNVKNKTINGDFLLSATKKNKGKQGGKDQILSQYVTCNKIKIELLSSYGYSNFIGWTGIQIYLIDKTKWNVESARTVGAWPKDVKTYCDISNDERIFENVFNNNNETTDENQMWMTYINDDLAIYPYIELTLDSAVKLNNIKFYNYNGINNLDKCVRHGKVYWYHMDEEVKAFEFYLHKGIGEQDIDYSQDWVFPFNEFKYTEEDWAPYYNINWSHLDLGLIYETPYLPCGKVIRLVWLNNYGNSKYISWNYWKIYNQFGKEIYPINTSGFVEADDTKVIVTPKNLSVSDTTKKEGNWGIKMKFWNQKWNDGEPKYNQIYYIFNIPICISYIKINNYHPFVGIQVKDIKIWVDDNIVYEGEIRKTINEKRDFIILFTGNHKIMEDINIRDLCWYGDECDDSFT